MELASLRPNRPSRALSDRIGVQLASRAGGTVVSWGWVGAAMGLAAAVAVVVFPLQKSVATTTAFRPVAAKDVLYAAKDEGYVQLVDGTPAHRLREYHLDTITWKNPSTNASLSWSVPRDEIRVIPASFQ